MGNDTATGRSKGSPQRNAETSSAKGRYRSRGKGSAEERSWLEVERAHDGLIHDAVVAVTSAGDALMLGRSRDGGALCAWVYCNGQRYGKCYGSVEEVVEALLDFIADAKLASGDL